MYPTVKHVFELTAISLIVEAHRVSPASFRNAGGTGVIVIRRRTLRRCSQCWRTNLYSEQFHGPQRYPDKPWAGNTWWLFNGGSGCRQ